MSSTAEEFTKKHLQDMLAYFGINVEVESQVEDGMVKLSIPSTEHSGFLIGEKGQTLRAWQHMLRLALHNQDFEIDRVGLDIAEYKQQRAERLAEQAHDWALAVKASGEEMALDPMNPVDRRTVHQTVNDVAGVATESRGRGHERHVVILPE